MAGAIRKARSGWRLVGGSIAAVAVLFLCWPLLRDGREAPGTEAVGTDANPRAAADPSPAPATAAEIPPGTADDPGDAAPGAEAQLSGSSAAARPASQIPPPAPASGGTTPTTAAFASSDSGPKGDRKDEPQFPRDWARCFRTYGDRDAYTFAADSSTASNGSWSARISSRTARPNPSGAALCQVLSAADFAGRRLRITLHIRTLDAMPGAHMVFRAEGADGRVLVFHNMAPHWVTGSTGWAEYSAVLDLPAQATTIMFGGSLVNTGSVWLDDAAIEIVGPEVPVTHRSAPGDRYSVVVDPSALAKALKNPGFEETRALRQGE